MGISFNRVALLGRVVNDPVVNGEWITFNMKTIVPKQGADKSWSEAEVMVPLLTNDPRKVETITNFVQDERQLYVEGYIEAWTVVVAYSSRWLNLDRKPCMIQTLKMAVVLLR